MKATWKLSITTQMFLDILNDNIQREAEFGFKTDEG
jgi:hypothetical protein